MVPLHSGAEAMAFVFFSEDSMKIHYDAELLEKARWIVEHGVDKPAKHEIERRPFLELPLPIYRKGEKHDEETWR
jgi:hypothetical protein